MKYEAYSTQCLEAMLAPEMTLMMRFDYLPHVLAQRTDYKTVVKELWKCHVTVSPKLIYSVNTVKTHNYIKKHTPCIMSITLQ